MQVVSSFLPFAPISWWARILDAETIIFDNAEHFEKMSYRNKYRISGANNPVQLSIPLISGRDQRTSMANVQIFNEVKWQVQHWRTLVSVYKLTPFWEYYEQTLQILYEHEFRSLAAFNKATFLWTAKQLKITKTIQETDIFIACYPEEVVDIRGMKPSKERELHGDFPKYYQVFEDRVGFLPNLSIIDLLFSEGPNTTAWINENRALLIR